MLRMTQIELLGFKSFPHKTTLDLSGGVNCIVGPNGSGKSNVADAIMFAFGSQSARELRTNNLSGLIFAGTEQLRPLNLASVTLHFECVSDPGTNGLPASGSGYEADEIEVPELALPASAGGSGMPGAYSGQRLWRHQPLAAQEYQDPTPAVMKKLLQLQPGERVNLTRRVFRDGSGGYFINGESVRLKDVDAFFDRYNMGRSAVFSVSQGEVERKILAGPQELREWLAEATGIALLLAQKDRAQNKLKKAQQNLERLSDILSHTRTLVADLSVQRRNAEAHLKLAAQLRSVELNEIRREIELCQRQLDSAGRALSEAESQINAERLRLESLQRSTETSQQEWRDCDRELAETEQQLSAQREESERLRRESAVALRALEAANAALAQARHDEQEAVETAGSLSAEAARASEAFRAGREGMAGVREEEQRLGHALKAAREQLEALSASQSQLAAQALETAQNAARLHNEREAVLRHAEQMRGQLEARRRHLEGTRERLAGLSAEHAVEQAQVRTLSEQVHALEEELGTIDSELGDLKPLIAQSEAEQALLRKRQAELNARRQALAEIDADRRRDTALSSLLSDVTLGGQLHSTTEISFAPQYRAAFTRLLSHLSEALVARPALREELLQRLGDSSEALLLEPAAPTTELHTDSIWRHLEADPLVRGALIGLLGDVCLVESLTQAEARLAEDSGPAAAVLRDGSALIGRGYSWLGHPPAERARAVSRRSDIESLDADIVQATGELRAADQLLAQLQARRSELGSQRDAGAGQHTQATERLRAASALAERMAAQLKDRNDELELLELQNAQLLEDQARLSQSLPLIEEQIRELEAGQLALKQQSAALEAEHISAAANLEAAREAHAGAQTARQLAEQSLQHLEQQSLNLAEQQNNLRRRIQQFESRIAALELERDASSHTASASGEQAEKLTAALAEINTRLERLREQRQSCAAAVEAAQTRYASQAQTVSRLEQDLAVLGSQRERALERLDAWLLELRERFNITLSQLIADPTVTAPPPDAEIDASEAGRGKLREEKTRLRSELEALGTVNLLSISQHEEQSSRLSFLEHQGEDLSRAAADLRGLVDKLDLRTESQYRANLEKIQSRFNALFGELFGGGSARLKFVQPEKRAAEPGATPTAEAAGSEPFEETAAAGTAQSGAENSIINAGVEVEVQLPGNRRHNLRSLSGGQRSLIFLALFFAVHSVRSPGFCILDEADAALDDANVARFARLIRHFTENPARPTGAEMDESHSEQFIVVTHNKRTMETADRLVGVVGRPKGVSNLLEVDLKAARGMVDKSA